MNKYYNKLNLVKYAEGVIKYPEDASARVGLADDIQYLDDQRNRWVNKSRFLGGLAGLYWGNKRGIKLYKRLAKEQKAITEAINEPNPSPKVKSFLTNAKSIRPHVYSNAQKAINPNYAIKDRWVNATRHLYKPGVARWSNPIGGALVSGWLSGKVVDPLVGMAQGANYKDREAYLNSIQATKGSN